MTSRRQFPLLPRTCYFAELGKKTALMTFRNRIFITALMLCHLVVWPCLVTSQLRPAQPVPTEEATVAADTQEKIGSIFTWRGSVKFTYGVYTMKADEVVYNQATGEVIAAGHLMFDGGPADLHMEAERGTYNVKTETGKFYNVTGTTGAKIRGKNVLLTSTNPFSFSGEVVEKAGPNRIIVHKGTVTSCELENPKWIFRAEKVDVIPGENAKLYHSTFRMEHVPIFYFPFARLPVERLGRQSGFLIPSIGQSSRKGTILGESVYWAMNRSMDATIGGEYWSSLGWAQHGTFRAKPSVDSFINFRYYGVLTHGAETSLQNQSGNEATLNAQDDNLWRGFRGVANIDYLSSYVFRLSFSETFTQAVNSEVKSIMFVSKDHDGFYFNAMASRYQNFESTTPGDLVNIVHAPSFDFDSVDHKLGNTPAYYSYDVNVEGVSRREPGFVTDNLVGRFDIFPRVAMPFHLKGWDFRPEIALRDTYYTQGQSPTAGDLGIPTQAGVNRKSFEGSFEVIPPSLSKILEKPFMDHKVKHVIEPRLAYNYASGVDNFKKIIRFDSRDILSDTQEIEYGITNRFYAKPLHGEKCGDPNTVIGETAAGNATPTLESTSTDTETETQEKCGVGAREVVSWEVTQKYFLNKNFGSAIIDGERNVFTTTEELTGISFLYGARRFSPLVSRLRVRTARNTDLDWHIDYDFQMSRINASTVVLSHHIGNFFVGGSHAFLETPTIATTTAQPAHFNQFRWLLGFGNPNKRGISAAANIGYDMNTSFLQYGTGQISYNWDCCGVSVEYRRFALGSVRNENQFRFALSLTNLGTFGTLRRQERLF